MREAFIESYQGNESFGWVVWFFTENEYQARIICKTYKLAETFKTHWIDGDIIGF